MDANEAPAYTRDKGEPWTVWELSYLHENRCNRVPAAAYQSATAARHAGLHQSAEASVTLSSVLQSSQRHSSL